MGENKKPRYFKDMGTLEKIMAIVGLVLEAALLVLLALDIFTDKSVTSAMIGVLAVFWASRACMMAARGESAKVYLALTVATVVLDVYYVFQ